MTFRSSLGTDNAEQKAKETGDKVKLGADHVFYDCEEHPDNAVNAMLKKLGQLESRLSQLEHKGDSGIETIIGLLRELKRLQVENTIYIGLVGSQRLFGNPQQSAIPKSQAAFVLTTIAFGFALANLSKGDIGGVVLASFIALFSLAIHRFEAPPLQERAPRRNVA